jgi:hypothetical protein
MKVTCKMNGFEVTAYAEIEERTREYPGSVEIVDHEVWVTDNTGALHRASDALQESILEMWQDEIDEALSQDISYDEQYED